MRLDLSVYGALLAASLGGAYWASLPEPQGDEEKISVFSIEPKAVAEVTFRGKDVEAVMSRRDDGRYQIQHTKTETPPPLPPDPTKKGETLPAPAPKVTSEKFLGNEKTDEFLKELNPLYASRVFSSVDDKLLQDFGIKDSTDTLIIKDNSGKTFKLTLGKRSYGSRSRFAKDEAGGRVFLVDDQNFENLERAPLRMFDRRLVGFDPGDADKAEVQFGKKVKRLAHTQREKSGELLWTEDLEGAQPKPQIGSWMDKVSKLRLGAYADDKEAAELKGQTPFLAVAFEKNGKPLDKISFFKTGGEKPVYWVTSDFLKVPAKIPAGKAEPIEKDAPQIMSEAKS